MRWLSTNCYAAKISEFITAPIAISKTPAERAGYASCMLTRPLGAIVGGALVGMVSAALLKFVLGVVLLVSAV